MNPCNLSRSPSNGDPTSATTRLWARSLYPPVHPCNASTKRVCMCIYIYVCTHIAQRKKAHARIPLPRTIPRRPPSIHSVHKVSYTWATTIRSIAVREGSHHAEWTNKNALSSRDKTIPATQCHIVTNFHKAPTTRCNITTKQLGSERVLPVANSPSNSPVLLTMKNYLLDHSVCATTEGRVDQCPIECCSF